RRRRDRFAATSRSRSARTWSTARTPTSPRRARWPCSSATSDPRFALAAAGGDPRAARPGVRGPARRRRGALRGRSGGRNERELDWYRATGEWRGRAGAYAIQGRGAAVVDASDGDYLNVVGLSVAALLALIPDLLGEPR